MSVISYCPFRKPHFIGPNRAVTAAALPQQKDSSRADSSSNAGPPPPCVERIAPFFVPPPPPGATNAPRSRLNAISMAFLGDSVYELYARRKFLYPPTKVDTYHSRTVEAVRAETQAVLFDVLMSEADPFLTAEERQVLSWAANAQVQVPPRLKKSDDGTRTYKKATAIEALTGYLYLTDTVRLHAFMARAVDGEGAA